MKKYRGVSDTEERTKGLDRFLAVRIIKTKLQCPFFIQYATRGEGGGGKGEREKSAFFLPSNCPDTPFDARHAHYATRAIHALASR